MNAISHQATCVAIEGRAILIEGEPGIGKTSLALALIDRGAKLIGDDGVLLERRDDRLWVLPHPNTRGLIEVRNVGIVTMHCGDAPAALVLELSDLAPRHIDAPGKVLRHGMELPCLSFWPSSPIGAFRAELALAVHGLTA
ncbi:HPr kinase/phosphorylase [Croceicoccus bisphenolivorans]|uniref:HPr kinase/phosphorylase n=1 Tax=Croceicoccus bisphenolivorans TaxID=1783232 RepID=UPI000830C2BE|nr:HPr kinase/phosphatase C-terminal domain-containing protein [Croceicoccus bisphenolivorans]